LSGLGELMVGLFVPVAAEIDGMTWWNKQYGKNCVFESECPGPQLKTERSGNLTQTAAKIRKTLKTLNSMLQR
jgi:hypothetical protein